MLTVNAYGATLAPEPLVPMTVERRDLGQRDVLIEIRYCGICHTDISHARSECRPEPYPLIPGQMLPLNTLAERARCRLVRRVCRDIIYGSHGQVVLSALEGYVDLDQ